MSTQNVKIRKGSLLVSEPMMVDNYFKRSVVLITEKSETGFVGFILNKVVDIKINEALNQFESLGVIKNARKLPLNQIEKCIFDLKNLMHSGDYDKQLIVDSLKKYIPDFQHIETGKSLDQKM